MNLKSNQISAKEKLISNKVGALFMQMGTGKTRVALDLINEVKDLDLIVWIGPLRTIKTLHNQPSVIDEINKWGGFICQNVIYIGIETLQSSDRQYLQLYKKISTSWRTFLIIDESIKIKNFDAKRTQRMLELSKMCEYKLILNGEPITRNLLDLWAQIQFLSPLILNMDIAEFKNTFCNYTTITKRFGTYKEYSKEFITGYENIDYLYSLIQEYIYECDLNLGISQIFEERTFTLSKEEKERYNYIKETYLDNEKLLMMNNNIFLEMTQKMQHDYSCSESKFKAVKDWIVDESKTIIFCKFINSSEACKKAFPEALVLNYKNGSHGLNLQDRPYTVFFDQTFDWGDFIQAQHRNYRTGQEYDCRYLKLVGNVGLENLIKDNNKKKINISQYFKKISKTQLKEVL